MIRRDPFDELALLIRGDTAGALGIAGRRLQTALRALADFDGGAVRHRHQRREALLRDAADALYGYTVQKELLGIADDEMLKKVHDISPEVWQMVGAIQSPSRDPS